MKWKVFIIILSVILLLSIAFVGGYFLCKYLSQQDEPDSNDDNSIVEDDDVVTPREYKLAKDVAVYVPWWDQDKAYESLQENSEYIKMVHPFWYEVKSDGSINKFTGAENAMIIEYCKDNNILLLPAISNEQSAEVIESVINSPTKTILHIENIMSIVNQNGYDGIEIDYENMVAKDRTNFSKFLQQLATTLHASNKLLAVAVHAKTSDAGNWGGPASQDWKAINNYADKVNVMAYDYHWSTSEAGNIAPISWIEQVLTYAVSVIDLNKLTLGIHLYGYDWVGKKSESLTYEGLQELLTAKSITNIKVSTEYEKYFTYKSNGTHTVYFADAFSVGKRLDLVAKYKIGGISMWRLGGEDSGVWDQIYQKLK